MATTADAPNPNQLEGAITTVLQTLAAEQGVADPGIQVSVFGPTKFYARVLGQDVWASSLVGLLKEAGARYAAMAPQVGSSILAKRAAAGAQEASEVAKPPMPEV